MKGWRREHPWGILGRWLYYGPVVIPFLPGPWQWYAIGWLILLLLSWWRRSYRLTHHRLTVVRGILWRRTTHIPLALVTTLTVERPLWMRLTGAARVAADTDAGHHKMVDVRLTVQRRMAHLFLPDSHNGTHHAIPTRRLWLLAVLSSDSLGGILLSAALIRRGSILLGQGLEQRVWQNLESAAAALALIPRTAALLTLLLLLGWLVGTARHLLRHIPFALCRQTDTLTIYSGWLTQRIHCCAIGAINYTDHRRTLTAHLFGLTTVYLNCTGYGKEKNTLAVLLPPCHPIKAQQEMESLLPDAAPIPLRVSPCRGAGWRYLRSPLLLLFFLSPVTGGLCRFFPHWQDFITHLAVMTAAPCLWWLAIRWMDRRSAGVGYADGRYTLCFSRRLTLHRVTIPAHKVALVQVRQTPWQRYRGRCDLLVFTNHEFRRPHRVRHLSIQELKQISPLFR